MPLQKQFRGLHNFTGDYDLGQHTFQLGGVIHPVMQIDSFMEPPRWAENTVDLDTLATGIPWPIAQVGASEVWRLHAMGCFTDGTMPTASLLRPCLILPGTSTIVGLQELIQTSLDTALGQRFITGVNFGTPGLHLEAGTNICLVFALKAAGSYPNIEAAVSYTKYSV